MCGIVNERTVSDGEAFAEGFRRPGVGKIVGTRILGGEIWLSQSNVLVDKGIATAAETGVFGLDGADAQLDEAVHLLLDELMEHPLPKVVAPRYPVKAVR
jgi:tricorn protease